MTTFGFFPARTSTARSAPEPLDGLAVQLVGGGPVAQQRPAARLDAERELGAAGLRRLRQPLERIAGELGVPQAGGCLDQFGQHPRGYPVVEGVVRGLPG